MKVNTDSLILGSWAQLRSDIEGAPRILDIGTGSGILALMMAQKAAGFRYPSDVKHGVESSEVRSCLIDSGDADCQNNTRENKIATSLLGSSPLDSLSLNKNLARIDAIEIDEDAAEQAATNFKNAKWSEQLFVYCCDVNGFTSPYLYDLVISNPPYFSSPAKVSSAYTLQSEPRTVARQTCAMGLDELFSASSKLLTEHGQLYCVYPASLETTVVEIAASYGLVLEQVLYVKHNADKSPYLCAFHFIKESIKAYGCSTSFMVDEDHLRFTAKNTNKNTLTIRDKKGEYTSEYKALCQSFYLKF